MPTAGRPTGVGHSADRVRSPMLVEMLTGHAEPADRQARSLPRVLAPGGRRGTPRLRPRLGWRRRKRTRSRAGAPRRAGRPAVDAEWKSQRRREARPSLGMNLAPGPLPSRCWSARVGRVVSVTGAGSPLPAMMVPWTCRFSLPGSCVWNFLICPRRYTSEPLPYRLQLADLSETAVS